ncbi:hypothetical protein [Aneurinibacillus aneurinilyticus]|uniref:hypothetical protein n=1 Tax=Aneurinibacillus aneurinilyticus TaxID=1391 RepID=UPI000408F48E|nr:hypothetical protein [Aneurinibacillus aneurinilyticus]MCI1693666.1 hypothetical protein [Aneurinibacillus aneurinilyticus]MED0709295.1 hypothetical protein [Aneurinibacillus aneurinilyticus]MED0724356.1 hypothetical protein [Aneurinibacillus aneurinilyticus]MED0730849.1 hypothetical protein [Aneurinibacillus aneurinilyticus]MED0740470.1 hypothetical protein [Aneurinibacillus aneurinilyticus]
MNLFIWIAIILVAHLIMYYALGTPTWIATSVLATLVWAAVLVISGALLNKRRRTRI